MTGAEPTRQVLVWSLKGRVGGGGLCGLELARALNAVPGVRADVCCLNGSELHALATTMQLTSHPMPLGGFQRRRAFAALLARMQPTLIINPMFSLRQIPLLPLVLRSPARYAMLVHEARVRPGNSTLADRVGALVQRWEVAQADVCVALSQYTADRLPGSVAPQNVLTCAHPAFTAAQRKSPSAVPGAVPRILFFGRGNASKGLDRLLSAHALLRQRFPVELLLCVKPAVADRLAGLDGVHCETAYLDEAALEARIAEADVVALPYENATQSGVAARAIGVGCPCVATPVGGLAEQVLHGRTGRVARDMTTAAFADALEAVLTDTSGYSELVQANLLLADGERSWSACARSLLAALP